MRRAITKVMLLPLLMLPALAAQAASCALGSNDFGFGPAFPGKVKDSTSAIVITCSSTAPPEMVSYSMALSAGNSNSYAPRRMNLIGDSSVHLDYNLFIDANRSQVWGDATGGTAVVTGSFTVVSSSSSTREMLPVYGRIFGGQMSENGDYADLLLVTVNF